MRIIELTKKYGDRKVLSNISFDILPGDFIGLIGPNGVGKTTLIGCICGTVKPDSGDIILNNKSLLKYPSETKHKIGVSFQEPIIDRFFSIFDTLKFVAMYNGLTYSNAKNRAEEIISLLKLHEFKYLCGDKLSGGTKKRLQIAMAMVHNPKILFLDEPSAGVDIEMREDIYSILKDLTKSSNQKSFVLTSHYFEDVKNLCNRIIFIKDGEVKKDIRKTDIDFTKGDYLYEMYKSTFPTGKQDA